jgi:hypothetical protein
MGWDKRDEILLSQPVLYHLNNDTEDNIRYTCSVFTLLSNLQQTKDTIQLLNCPYHSNIVIGCGDSKPKTLVLQLYFPSAFAILRYTF